MKKLVLVHLAAFLVNVINAQGTKSASATPLNNAHLKVFKQAVNSGDIATGITALNYYVNEQGANPVYEDTLAMLYLQQNAYLQCYYWSNKRLSVKPDDLILMEMKGISLDKLNQPKEAIDIFEKLYAKTQSPFHAFTLMELQYSIKRLAECLATASSTEKLVFKPDYIISYNAGGQSARTYLQAGIFNITGLTLYDLDRKAESKLYFEKALALDSNFVLAKQNLEAIKSLESGKSNANPKDDDKPTSPGNKQN